MQVRIEQIGSSRIIRLPKVLLPGTRIGDVIDLHLKPNHFPSRKAIIPRHGWAEAARRMRAQNEDRPVIPYVPTRFEQKDWKWE